MMWVTRMRMSSTTTDRLYSGVPSGRSSAMSSMSWAVRSCSP